MRCAWLLPLVLLGAGPSLNDRRVDYLEAVEINTFGERASAQTAVIYRDRDGIRDWRWLSCLEQIPRKLRPGWYISVWQDQGAPRVVYCRSVIYSRTSYDVELREREKLPEERRRKLSR